MSNNNIEQVNATRNQSIAKYTFDHIFLGNNDFEPASIDNQIAAGTITVRSGTLMFKNSATTVDKFSAATQIVDIVGIARMDEEVSILDDGTLDINIGIRGDIAEELIELPGGITLDTVIPTTNRTLRDHLNSLGFHLYAGVENTKFDNE